jgi:glucose/arabinose dehydrogenase
MKKHFAIAVGVAVSLAAGPAVASEPDGLVLPPGFHAVVVAEGLGSIRHMAIRGNGDIYLSTTHGRTDPSVGIIAVRLGPDHKAAQVEHFSTIDQGTGIRIYRDALYTTSETGVYRFPLDAKALVPTALAQTVVGDLPRVENHAIAFDGKGNLYVSMDGAGNICQDPTVAKGSRPVGLKPCPKLETMAGIWRFDDAKLDQKMSDGEHFATGIRDSSSLDWHAGDALYVATHGRDGMHTMFPEVVSVAEDDAIADEMFRVEKGTDFGWPYTYYDGARKIRLTGPEYGGDGKTAVTGTYATPVVAFSQPRRPAVLDLAFYTGKQFPRMYRGGAFLALHGGLEAQSAAHDQAGFSVVFVPFKGSHAGLPVTFADGFAGPAPHSKTLKTAVYRPVGVAVGPDGALYVADSNKGRIWRIAYGEKP